MGLDGLSGRPLRMLDTAQEGERMRVLIWHGWLLEGSGSNVYAARIAEEIVQHLTGLVGSNVEITIEIHADLAQGAGDKLVRDVTENCRTLKFKDYGFEEK